MKETLSILVQAESQAFHDSFGLSGHLRGDERPGYCAVLKEREKDRDIGFLLRNISEFERKTLRNFTSADLASLERHTHIDLLRKNSEYLKKTLEGTVEMRGGRWSPKASFREKVTTNWSHNCWPGRFK